MNKIVALGVLSTGLVAAFAGPATAATYHCSPKGSDSSDGIDAPWRTLQKAASTMRAGDTLLIADGNYPGDVVHRRSGAPGAPITYRAENPGRAVVRDGTIGFLIDNADHVVLDGLRVSGNAARGVRILVSHNVTVRNCVLAGNGIEGLIAGYCDDLVLENNEAFGNGRGYPGYPPGKGHGLYVSSSGDRPIVRDNVCRDNGGCGIQVNGFGDPSIDGQLRGIRVDHIISEAQLQNNQIFRNGRGGGAAINMQSVRDSLLINNLLAHNLAGGIACFADYQGESWGCRNNRLVNNTVYFAPGTGRYGLQFLEGSRSNQVYYNLILAGRGPALEYDTSSGTPQSDRNSWYSSSGEHLIKVGDRGYTLAAWLQRARGRTEYSYTAKELFENPDRPTAEGFRLAANSPAIARGRALAAFVALRPGTAADAPIDLGWAPATVAVAAPVEPAPATPEMPMPEMPKPEPAPQQMDPVTGDNRKPVPEKDEPIPLPGPKEQQSASDAKEQPAAPGPDAQPAPPGPKDHPAPSPPAPAAMPVEGEGMKGIGEKTQGGNGRDPQGETGTTGGAKIQEERIRIPPSPAPSG